MFEKINPPAKWPSTWLNRDVKKVLVLLFRGLGWGFLGIAGILFLMTRFNDFIVMASCIGTLVSGGLFLIVAEYFDDFDDEGQTR